MTSGELRKKFLSFFIEKGHKQIPSSSLIDVTDPSVLLTTAGMQQFKDYFSEKREARQELGSEKITTVQKCFRTSDIDEVGDKDHLTFLEMLGNFCFNGAYWKKEAIGFAFDFFTKELDVKKEDLKVTVFAGDEEVPFDRESHDIWISLGLEENQITKRGREDNFWGPTGEEGPCGPTTELYLDDSEIWNIVFNEYYQDKKGGLVTLDKKGIDTGMGLERLARVMQKKETVFETDLFFSLMEILRMNKYETNQENKKLERVIVDHIRGSVFLIAEGLAPSNLKEGYILRRILRRSVRAAMKLNLKDGWYVDLVDEVIRNYSNFWPEVGKDKTNLIGVIEEEVTAFKKALLNGTKELEKKLAKIEGKVFPGDEAFKLYESCGFPPELTRELLEERGFTLDEEGFEKAKKEHQTISKTVIEKKEGGLRENPTGYEIKLHTATHLLHKALRNIFGEEVKQMGSDISEKRLRFDFSFGRVLTDDEIAQVEKIVNQKIKEDLKVKRIETTYDEAVKMGALGFFKEKYPERVSVYRIGPSGEQGDFYSCEICRGPHIQLTSELKSFKIIKQESVGAGVKRIKANILR
jgi:alanyl-tRNA synthetase